MSSSHPCALSSAPRCLCTAHKIVLFRHHWNINFLVSCSPLPWGIAVVLTERTFLLEKWGWSWAFKQAHLFIISTNEKMATMTTNTFKGSCSTLPTCLSNFPLSFVHFVISNGLHIQVKSMTCNFLRKKLDNIGLWLQWTRGARALSLPRRKEKLVQNVGICNGI